MRLIFYQFGQRARFEVWRSHLGHHVEHVARAVALPQHSGQSIDEWRPRVDAAQGHVGCKARLSVFDILITCKVIPRQLPPHDKVSWLLSYLHIRSRVLSRWLLICDKVCGFIC